MILTSRVAAGVADGSVSLAFRRWKTLRVKPGNTFRSTAGVVAVGDISVIAVGDITEQQAQAAGAASKDELVKTFRGDPRGSCLQDRADVGRARHSRRSR